MKLINADKIKEELKLKELSHIIKQEEYLDYVLNEWKTRVVELGSYNVIEEIDNAPTVDAIPIEWLKNKRDELEKEYYNLFHVYTDESKNNQVQLLNDFHAFNTVLGYWEKENEG